MKQKSRLTTQNMVLIGMFAGILSILSQISFILPGSMPITLQTFGVSLIGTVLGAKLGSFTIIIYLFLGLAGLPVFANFKSGAGVLFGPTGGYLVGFILMVLFIGMGRGKKSYISFFHCFIGILICHVCGLAVYHIVTNTYLPFAPILFVKDYISSILAILSGRELSKRLNHFQLEEFRGI